MHPSAIAQQAGVQDEKCDHRESLVASSGAFRFAAPGTVFPSSDGIRPCLQERDKRQLAAAGFRGLPRRRVQIVPRYSAREKTPSRFLSFALNSFSALARSSVVAPKGMYSSKLETESSLASNRLHATFDLPIFVPDGIQPVPAPHRAGKNHSPCFDFLSPSLPLQLRQPKLAPYPIRFVPRDVVNVD